MIAGPSAPAPAAAVGPALGGASAAPSFATDKEGWLRHMREQHIRQRQVRIDHAMLSEHSYTRSSVFTSLVNVTPFTCTIMIMMPPRRAGQRGVHALGHGSRPSRCGGARPRHRRRQRRRIWRRGGSWGGGGLWPHARAVRPLEVQVLIARVHPLTRYVYEYTTV